MNILNRYVGWTVIQMIGLVILIIAGLQGFIGFIAEMHSIGKAGYGVWQAFLYELMNLPQDVYPLFPVATLIGCLLGLGRLASQSELIVMRAAGVSKMQITGSVMLATLWMLLFVTFIGEGLGPFLKEQAALYKVAQQNDAKANYREGVWLRDKDNFIHVDAVLPSGKLLGVLRYQFDQQRLLLASVALTGEYANGHWVFTNVKETIFHPTQTLVKSYPEQLWPVSFDAKLLNIIDLHPAQTSLNSLYHHITYLKNNGLSASTYEFNFWKRFLQPLTTLVMIGLAVPFIFGPLRTVTMGLRILVGVVIGFGFYTLNEFLGPFSLVYQVSPVGSAAAPVVLFGIIGLVLLQRAR